MTGPRVVGIDLSSHAIDLVAISENANLAEWTRVNLNGHDAWQRTRTVRQTMPPATFWDDVYLAAIERPFGASRRGQAVLMRVEGAILASIPAQVEVWEVQPQTWKAALGYTGRGKPGLLDFPPFDLDAHNGGEWEGGVIGQDALDALGVALYARNLNAAGIAQALAAG